MGDFDEGVAATAIAKGVGGVDDAVSIGVAVGAAAISGGVSIYDGQESLQK